MQRLATSFIYTIIEIFKFLPFYLRIIRFQWSTRRNFVRANMEMILDSIRHETLHVNVWQNRNTATTTHYSRNIVIIVRFLYKSLTKTNVSLCRVILPCFSLPNRLVRFFVCWKYSILGSSKTSWPGLKTDGPCTWQ